MSETLKPCPFCGAELGEESCVDSNEGVGYTPMYTIWCLNCSASSASYREMDDAYAAWNRRAFEPRKRWAEMSDEEKQAYMIRAVDKTLAAFTNPLSVKQGAEK
jgi:Lar family restriction alleviation protein